MVKNVLVAMVDWNSRLSNIFSNKMLLWQNLEKEIEKHLADVKKIVDIMKNKDDLPGILQERLSEASTLLHTIPKELKEREQYLTQNKKLVPILKSNSKISFGVARIQPISKNR